MSTETGQHDGPPKRYSFPGEPEEQLNPKKKVFETIQPDITTTSDLIVAWKGMPLVVSGKGVVRTSSIPAAVVK